MYIGVTGYYIQEGKNKNWYHKRDIFDRQKDSGSTMLDASIRVTQVNVIDFLIDFLSYSA